MKLKVYEYSGCSTCKNALKFLDARRIPYDKIAIRETPPTKKELKAVLATLGDIRKLFNTSGQEYRRLKISEILPGLSEAAALDLLASNGSLVKRPVVIGAGIALAGFREGEWTATGLGAVPQAPGTAPSCGKARF
jgi:arsenate reductase (glutaredoxin)